MPCSHRLPAGSCPAGNICNLRIIGALNAAEFSSIAGARSSHPLP
jgi:hypothetical protein